jgi:glycogen phosphorylase
MSPSIQEESFENEIATIDDDRTGIKVDTLKRAILENLRYVVGKDPEFATEMDYFMAIAYTVRDRILARWLATRKNYSGHDVRLVCYLSAEFLMGPHMANNLLNLGVEDASGRPPRNWAST